MDDEFSISPDPAAPWKVDLILAAAMACIIYLIYVVTPYRWLGCAVSIGPLYAFSSYKVGFKKIANKIV